MDPIQTADSVLNEALDAEKEVKDQNDLSLFYNRFLSKKGKASTLMTLMKEVKAEHKAAFGKKVNEVKASIVSFYEAKKKELEAEKARKENLENLSEGLAEEIEAGRKRAQENQNKLTGLKTSIDAETRNRDALAKELAFPTKKDAMICFKAPVTLGWKSY